MGQSMATEQHLTLRTARLRPAEEWSTPGRVMAFLLALAGTGRHVQGAAIQVVRTGDVLMLNQASAGKLAAQEGSEFVFGWFSLCPEHLFPLLNGSEISLWQKVAEACRGARVYAAASAPARECHRLAGDVPPQLGLDHRSQLLRIAAVILSVEFKEVARQRSGFVRIEEHMLGVFEALSTAEILGSSVVKLADKFGCSRRHLNRLFHQYFGVSVGALKMEMRLLKAMSLLRNPDAKVMNVAEDCGFKHLGLFSTCFKRRFGVSAGQWRQLSAQPEVRPAEGPGAVSGDVACPLRPSGLCPWAGNSSAGAPAPLRAVQGPAANGGCSGRGAGRRSWPAAMEPEREQAAK